jgi:uncharacterized protein
MHVLISGASGLIGSALAPFLTTGGHRVTRLVRSRGATPSDEAAWDPDTGEIDRTKLAGLDAVVHLAGENLFGLWTEAKRRRLRASRIEATRRLCESLSCMEQPPKVFLSASAVGYYGDRGEERLDEDARQGVGFLAELCRDWEAATDPIAQKGARVVHLRFGIVLSPKGGALAKMLLPFKMGVGGTLGGGRQYMSWISIEDAVGAVHHALSTDLLKGPVNVVAPGAVTNREFTKTLGKVLGRPTVFPVPAPVLRLVFRDMAREVLLGSQRVEPSRLLESGYAFRHPQLEGALRAVLGR